MVGETVVTNRPNFAMQAQNMAITKLARGPAAATKAASRRGLFKFCHVMGTGLAHPKAKVKLLTTSIRIGKNTVPNQSIWRGGFKEKRPNSHAVRWPHCLATQPCAASCKGIP